MKITEVNQPSLKAIREDLEQNNDTGFLTEDLMKIAEQHNFGTWSGPMTLEESLAEDQRIIAEALKNERSSL